MPRKMQGLARCTNKDKSLDVLHGDVRNTGAYAQWKASPTRNHAGRPRSGRSIERRSFMKVQTRDSAVTAATGHHAPTSGWWRPDGDVGPFRYLRQGEVMPSLEGAQALWILLYELDPSLRVRYRSSAREKGDALLNPSPAPATATAEDARP